MTKWTIFRIGLLWLPGVIFLLGSSVIASEFDYQLEVVNIAPDTYVFVGKDEHFTFANGGNIVNTAFVVTGDGVLVWDSGPSLQYAQQAREIIKQITQQPIKEVMNSHLHPDHFLGNQAYSDVNISSLQNSLEGLGGQVEGFTENMYRLVGDAMAGSQPILPKGEYRGGKNKLVKSFVMGKHHFFLYALGGHAGGDLVMLDRSTGVLFAGDLVFNKRVPTTPHADIRTWLDSLVFLSGLDSKLVIPGHGAISDSSTIEQTSKYLQWLHQTLEDAAARGFDMAEVLEFDIKEPYRHWAVSEAEFKRSVAHLFPGLEQAQLLQLTPASGHLSDKP